MTLRMFNALTIAALLSSCALAQIQALPDKRQDAAKSMGAFDQAMSAGRLLEHGGAMELLQQLQSVAQPDDWTDAKERLLTALVRQGDRVISRYVTGDEVPQHKDDYERCAKDFEAANKLDGSPRSAARASFCAGRALLEPDQQRDFGLAIKDFEQAIKDEPDAGYHYNALGIAYLEQAKNTEAAEQFRKAIQREPSWAYPRHHLALTYLETGDYVSAEAEYREAIKVADANKLEFGYLHYNLGLLAHQLGHKKEAMGEYERALLLFQQQQHQNEQRAHELQAQSNEEEAQAALARASVFMRDEAEAYNAIGALCASQGKKQRAEEAYNEALKLNPQFPAARQNLDLLHNRGKRQVGAKRSPSTAAVSAGEFHPKD
jgi:tetratricopeptide (TPR) repeat protein